MEALADMELIGRRLVARYNVERRFVVTTQSATPTATCCVQNFNNEGGLCVPVLTDWRGNATWDAIPFQKKAPFAYQYAYTGVADGGSATATATGNLDCDASTVVITLACDVDVLEGTPRCRLIMPANED